MRYTILTALIIAAFAISGCEKALDIEKEKAESFKPVCHFC